MTLPDGDPRPWRRVKSDPGPDLIIAQARFDTLENPRTGRELRRLVLSVRDWVNVVALTPDRRLVCVKQYRFGQDRVITEIPGGVVDPGEEPFTAARRELREETGFTTERWTPLGRVAPNPAFQTNTCHHFLAEGVERTHELELDDGEDIVVALLEVEEVRAAVARGEIRHSLVLCALARVFDLRTEPR